jgi:hypothetical protein
MGLDRAPPEMPLIATLTMGTRASAKRMHPRRTRSRPDAESQAPCATHASIRRRRTRAPRRQARLWSSRTLAPDGGTAIPVPRVVTRRRGRTARRVRARARRREVSLASPRRSCSTRGCHPPLEGGTSSEDSGAIPNHP